MSDEFRVKITAAEAADELQAEGELDFGPDTTLVGVVVAVAVNHGDKGSIHYRFKDAVGNELDRVAGIDILRRILDAVEHP